MSNNISQILAVRSRYEPIKSLAFGSITADYNYIGTSRADAALENPSRKYIISNFTDVDLMFSWDGVNDQIPVMARTQFVSDESSNRSDQAGVLCVAQGDVLWVRSINDSPSENAVYLSNNYASTM